MKEKQRKSNVAGSTELPNVTTGGSNKLSDVMTVSNVSIDVKASAEIDTSVSPGNGDVWASRSSWGWNIPFRVCQTVVGHEKALIELALLDSMVEMGERQNLNSRSES